MHVLADYWQKKGLAAKTIHGLFSNVREFTRWIGKDGMIQDISVYCGGREHLVRKNAATVDHSWEACGIDIDMFLETARALDERLWIQLRLQRDFGLRAKEALEFRPHRATVLDEAHIYITDGTKGGRHRVIPIRSDRQRETIAAAKEIVGPHLNAQIRWPDKSWRQAQAHFYYLMRKLGATHNQLGATAHGLRHGFLQDEYLHFAGVPAPIKAAGVHPETRNAHQRAMLAVSLEAGHFRPSATGMYCGSLGHKLRSKCKPERSTSSEKLKDHTDQEEGDEG